MVANVKWAKEPIKAKLFQIGLGDLDELRFDLDLLWTGGIRLFNQGVNHIEVVGRVTHDQCSVMWKEGCICAGWKTNAHALQHRSRIRPLHDLTIICQLLPFSSCSIFPRSICMSTLLYTYIYYHRGYLN